MKKAKLSLFILSLSLLLPGIPVIRQENGTRKNLTVNSDYDTVCVKGDFTQYQTEKTLLPNGYYGNYPDEGIAEIGGKAGDPNGITMPSFFIGTQLSSMFYFTFSDDIRNFSSFSATTKIGFRISYDSDKGKDQVYELYNEAKKFKDAFDFRNEDFALSNMRIYGDNSIVLSYSITTKSVVLTFNFQSDYKINSVKLFYGDKPEGLVRCGIVEGGSNFKENILLDYKGNDCSARKYTESIGKNPVYRMKSQIGTVYSKHYLLNSFIYEDDYDGEKLHPTVIQDPEDYFGTGAKAALGTEFTLKIQATDNSGNSSYLTLIITVVDTKGPKTVLRNNIPIEVPYNTDLLSKEFLEKHFLLSDNNGGEIITAIGLENGLEVPKNQIGDFSCLLTAKDTNDNQTTLPFKLNLYDNVLPAITAEQEELNLTPNNRMSKDTLLALFTVTDEVDGSLLPEIVENTYQGNEGKTGNYVFKVKGTDKSGNMAEKSIVIKVSDTEGPVWFAKESFLTVTEGDVPTLTEVTEALIRQKVIEDKKYTEAEIIEGEKLDNSLSLGLHQLKLRLTDEEDNSIFVNLTVKVIEKDKINSTAKDTSFFASVSLFFTDMWTEVCKFFQDLWKNIVSFFTGSNN